MIDKMMKKCSVKSFAMCMMQYLLCLLITFITGFPFLMILINSFKSQKDYFLNPWGIPSGLYLGNLERVFTMDFLSYFRNSIFVSGVSVAIIILSSSMVSYAITKLKFKGARFLQALIMVGMMIPVHTTLVPIYVMSKELGLYNHLIALIGPYVSFAIPVSTIILSQFFRDVPHEIEEAAIIDGCGRFNMYARIIMPLAKPALSTVIIYDLLQVWNEFIYAMTLIDTTALKTLPVGLKDFFGVEAVNIPSVMCAVLVSSLPVIIAYFLAQEQIIGGLTSGAVKG